MAKKRVIDAVRAMEIVRDQGIAHPSAYHLTNYATMILQEAPTEDAVEVVRCKDCKYSWEDLSGLCCSYGVCVDCTVPDDFYCAYAIRKER